MANRELMSAAGIVIRDHRRPEHAWFYNQVLDSYAAKVGMQGWAVYTTLCRYASTQTGYCHVSIDRIALLWQVSRATIKRCTKALRDCGLIHVEKKQGVSHYHLLDVRPDVRPSTTERPAQAATAPLSPRPTPISTAKPAAIAAQPSTATSPSSANSAAVAASTQRASNASAAKNPQLAQPRLTPEPSTRLTHEPSDGSNLSHQTAHQRAIEQGVFNKGSFNKRTTSRILESSTQGTNSAPARPGYTQAERDSWDLRRLTKELDIISEAWVGSSDHTFEEYVSKAALRAGLTVQRAHEILNK